MTNEQFYAESAALLEVVHQGEPFPYRRRNRWNNRKPGQGRFEGAGIIRVFGDFIHVSLSNPKLWGIFTSKEEALDAIRIAVRK